MRKESWPRQQQVMSAWNHANSDLRRVAHDLTVDRQLGPGARVDGQKARELAWARGRSRSRDVPHRIRHYRGRHGHDWAATRGALLVRGRDGAPDTLIVGFRHARAGLEECDAGNDEHRSNADGDQGGTPPGGARRRLPLVVQDPRGRRSPGGLGGHRPITLNDVLVALLTPGALATSVHPVQRPVTLRLLNVAMPFTGVTVVWPLRELAAMGPWRVTVTG